MKPAVNALRFAALAAVTLAMAMRAVAAGPLPEGVKVVRDVAYGDDGRQRFDVYAPEHASGAPIILMVHGGGWSRGDKALGRVVDGKVARWVPRGFIFVSTNYRMVPEASPVEQARDVARALAAVQRGAASWGGDRAKVVLMGHSAGAHLVALLTAAPARALELGALPWLGSVFLDSGALDVPRLMARRHLPLYDKAFGRDPAKWEEASPYQALGRDGPPMLAVCSATRADRPCAEAERFVARAESLGRRSQVLQENFSHGEINAQLGKDPGYTDAVESFLRTLDGTVAKSLARGG